MLELLGLVNRCLTSLTWLIHPFGKTEYKAIEFIINLLSWFGLQDLSLPTEDIDFGDLLRGLGDFIALATAANLGDLGDFGDTLPLTINVSVLSLEIFVMSAPSSVITLPTIKQTRVMRQRQNRETIFDLILSLVRVPLLSFSILSSSWGKASSSVSVTFV